MFLEKFTFESRRHSAYPFALSLYVNGLIDCRISVCCEYKHKIGLPLGGKRATFAILNVQGGKPCQTFVTFKIIFSFLIYFIFYKKKDVDLINIFSILHY